MIGDPCQIPADVAEHSVAPATFRNEPLSNFVKRSADILKCWVGCQKRRGNAAWQYRAAMWSPSHCNSAPRRQASGWASSQSQTGPCAQAAEYAGCPSRLLRSGNFVRGYPKKDTAAAATCESTHQFGVINRLSSAHALICKQAGNTDGGCAALYTESVNSIWRGHYKSIELQICEDRNRRRKSA